MYYVRSLEFVEYTATQPLVAAADCPRPPYCVAAGARLLRQWRGLRDEDAVELGVCCPEASRDCRMVSIRDAVESITPKHCGLSAAAPEHCVADLQFRLEPV